MTVTLDPEYWRQDRDDWKQRRLHWHCYSATVDGSSWGADKVRRDRGSDLPPLIVREWLVKAVKPKQSPTTPEEAVAWLRREFDRHAGQMAGSQATDIPEEIRWGTALYDLRCGSDLSWGFWLTGGARIVSMAVVGIADCPIHR